MRSFLLTILLSLPGILLFRPLYGFSGNGDSVKPIPQINKEFLIIAHLVHDKSGGAASKSSILSAIAAANDVFRPIGVSFKVCEFRDIHNFTYDTLKEKYQNELYNKYYVEKRINMFFVSDFPDRPKICGFASLEGISFTGKVPIVIKCPSGPVIAHELGHFFGLPHTFEGSGAEYADGSNCSIAGDGICDTPADPYDNSVVSDYVDDNCVFINKRKDNKGVYFDPDVSNLMGYYNHCYCMKFTRGQYEKMAKTYLSNPIMW